MKKKIVVLSGIFALMFVISGCGESSGSASSDKPQPVVVTPGNDVVVAQDVSGVKGLSNLPSIPALPEQ